MQLTDANVRSSSYFIAETRVRCARCGEPCRVLAIGLPPNHETLVEDEWQMVDANAFIFHFAALPDAVSRHLFEQSANFRQTRGDDPSESSWANHCPHCAAAQAISLTKVERDFSAVAAGYALEPEFFAWMRVL